MSPELIATGKLVGKWRPIIPPHVRFSGIITVIMSWIRIEIIRLSKDDKYHGIVDLIKTEYLKLAIHEGNERNIKYYHHCRLKCIKKVL